MLRLLPWLSVRRSAMPRSIALAVSARQSSYPAPSSSQNSHSSLPYPMSRLRYTLRQTAQKTAVICSSRGGTNTLPCGYTSLQRSKSCLWRGQTLRRLSIMRFSPLGSHLHREANRESTCLPHSKRVFGFLRKGVKNHSLDISIATVSASPAY